MTIAAMAFMTLASMAFATGGDAVTRPASLLSGQELEQLAEFAEWSGTCRWADGVRLCRHQGEKLVGGVATIYLLVSKRAGGAGPLESLVVASVLMAPDRRSGTAVFLEFAPSGELTRKGKVLANYDAEGNNLGQTDVEISVLDAVSTAQGSLEYWRTQGPRRAPR